MSAKKTRNMVTAMLLLVSGMWMAISVSSCGKGGGASAAGLNIQYEILNLSPDLYPVNLYIDFTQVNKANNPFIYGVNHGYFYIPSIDTPYQIRTAAVSNATLLSRGDILQPGAKYSLFIFGSLADGSKASMITVDTATLPAIGRGKVRFLNVSPTATAGLDLYANTAKLFTNIVFKKSSAYTEVPVGVYDFQLNATGSTSVLKDMPNITIQDGRLYTIYAYGYTTRIDTAAFNAAMITNK